MTDYFGFAEELIIKGRAEVGETYGNVELYDLLVRSTSDAEFYVNLAKEKKGKVLDLACGSGRLLPFLLEAGLEVYALDLSPEMIERARLKLGNKAAEVRFFVDDMRQFSFKEKFDTIVIPYCSFMYLHNDSDRLEVFQRCYDHLESGGNFAFDFLAGEVQEGEGFPSLALQGVNPLTDEVLISVVQIKGLAPDLRLLNQINYVLSKDGNSHITVHASKEAVLKTDRILELLKQIGFKTKGVYNDHNLTAYDGGESCLLVMQK
ncbi:MAG: class I SAM-dependent methyltransferase [Bacillota bacterium]|nr:class I SAM-dependent methyltransferase [Bacillota bacterium]